MWGPSLKTGGPETAYFRLVLQHYHDLCADILGIKRIIDKRKKLTAKSHLHFPKCGKSLVHKRLALVHEWCVPQNAVRKLQLPRAIVLYVQFVVVPFYDCLIVVVD